MAVRLPIASSGVSPGAFNLSISVSATPSSSKSAAGRGSIPSTGCSRAGLNVPSARQASGGSPRKARKSSWDPSGSRPQKSVRPSPSRSAAPLPRKPGKVWVTTPVEAASMVTVGRFGVGRRRGQVPPPRGAPRRIASASSGQPVGAVAPPSRGRDGGEDAQGAVGVPPPERVGRPCPRGRRRRPAPARPAPPRSAFAGSRPRKDEVATRSRTPSRSRSGASMMSNTRSLPRVSGRIGRVHRGRPVGRRRAG